MVEYALILALVSVAAVAILSTLGRLGLVDLQRDQPGPVVRTKDLNDQPSRGSTAGEVYHAYVPRIRGGIERAFRCIGVGYGVAGSQRKGRHQVEKAKQIPMRMYLALTALRDREEGQAMVEYALILALVSVAAVAILSTLGDSVSSIFSEINKDL